MTDLGSERNPVEALAEDFVERFRRGERPALSEYTMRYPELADDIRDLFPALVMLEDVRPTPGFASSAGIDSEILSGGRKLERLGDYRILRQVGRGGMGVVYEAEQESLGRHVALKVLLTHALHDPRQLQRFQREARAAARLHHTNIVPVFGVGEHEGLHYYVMQFITGQGLDQVLTELYRLRLGSVEVTEIGHGVESIRPPNSNDTASAVAVARALLTGVFSVPAEEPSAMPAPSVAAACSSEVRVPGKVEHATLSDSGRQYWQSVARIGIQVADALGYAHGQGTLHRDIKPANLLLDTQGNVWITDFGLAKGHDSEDLTHTGDVVGTLRYLAPERFQGKGDARSDLYALGLTLYELLTLRPAFNESDRSKLVHQVMHEEPPRPRKLNAAVPRDLETVVLKAIAREPAHRYQTAAEFADDLRRFMDDKPINARRVSETEKLWRWSRRNPTLAGFVALFIATVIFGSAGIAWKWREAEERRGEAEEQKAKVTRAEHETARQRDEAIEAHKKSQRVLAGALLDKGTGLAEKGEIDEGLFWMLEALKVVPENTPDLVRVIRTNLAAWLDRTHDTRLIIEQPETVEWCVFSPDGQRFYTASSNIVQAWETATGRPAGAPLVLDGSACAALSPDGKTIITGINPWGGKPAKAQRWDAIKGQPLGPPLPHPARVTCVAFAPDGKQLVTGCRDGTVRLWDSASGNLVGERFRHDQASVSGVEISPDGKSLAVAATIESSLDAQGHGYLVDLASGKRIAPPLLHKGALRSVAFSPTGKTVLLASMDGVAQLWDAVTGQSIGLPLRHPHGVLTAKFNPDGRSIVTGSRDGIIRYWDSASGSELAGAHLVNKHGVNHLAISPDGGTLLAVTGWEKSPGSINLFQLGQSLSRPATKARDVSLRATWIARDAASFFKRQLVSYSPDARRVLTGGTNGFANLSDAATGQPAFLRGPSVGPFRHAYKGVAVTAFSPNGRYFATASIDATARSDAHLWDAATGMPVGPPLPQINYVAAMAFSPDSKILATGGYDCVVRLWNTTTGAPIGPILRQRDIVLTLAFSPDSKTLAVGHAADYSGATGTVLWNVETRKTIGAPLPGPFVMICFSPDGRSVLTATDSKVRLWDAATAEPRGPAFNEPATINQVVFRSDGRMLLLGCADGTVRLRDLSTGKTVGAPMLHPYEAYAVAFSPDREGKLILAGYADGSARIWDRATQKPLGPPVLQSSPIYGVAFSPDGHSFLTTSADGNTRQWPVPHAAEESVEQIALRLEVRTALEMGEGQTVVKLAPAEWQRRRQLLGDPRCDEADDQKFHEARARDAEQDGDGFAAKWHLDRLIAALEPKADPSAWLLYARRARCQMADLGRFDEAAADYDVALTRGSRQELSNWYRHCLADGQAAKSGKAALWYLDRVIAAEPSDWRLYADRATVYEKLDRMTDREADLTRAAELGADSSFLNQLGEEYARRGEWQKSKAAIAMVWARGQAPNDIAHANALLCLKTDDPAGYRKVCAGLLAKAERSPPANTANALAWICAIGPDAVADYTQPIALAELAVAKALPGAKSGALNTLGAVLFRAGRHRESIACLNQGIQARNGDGGVHDWIFLAMAHHRLGEIDEAKKFLTKATQYPLQKRAFSWDRLEIEVLRGEANSLIDAKSAGAKN